MQKKGKMDWNIPDVQGDYVGNWSPSEFLSGLCIRTTFGSVNIVDGLTISPVRFWSA